MSKTKTNESDSSSAAADGRDPLDEVLDLLVYAPLGLALELRTLLPGLIERGRRQMSFARSVGQLASKSINSPPPRAAKSKASAAARPDPAPSPKSAAKTTVKAPPMAAAKKAAPKNAAPKKAAPKKAAPKKAAPRKVQPKKAAPKKAAPKKTVAKKTAPRKVQPKKAAPKKAAPKKTVAKKTAPKKAVAKKAAPKRAVPRKAAAKKPAAVRTLNEILPDYEAQSARIILGALASLSTADLGVVHDHEQANRARVTVMNRIAQLRKV